MAFGWDDLLGLGGSLLGGIFGSSSSKKASESQANAASAAAAAQERSSKAAIAEQKRQFDLIRGDQEPARAAGGQALNFLKSLLMPEDPAALSAKLAANNKELATLSNMVAAGKKLTASQAALRRLLMGNRAQMVQQRQAQGPNVTNYLTNLPGYQFQSGELQKAIDRRANATGTLRSGRGMKEMTRWMNDSLVAPTYRNWLSDLSSVAGYGRDANATNASAGLSTSNAISNILGNQGQATAAGILGAGDARAQGQLGSAAAWNNAMNNGMNWLLWRNSANPLSGNSWLNANPGWS